MLKGFNCSLGLWFNITSKSFNHCLLQSFSTLQLDFWSIYLTRRIFCLFNSKEDVCIPILIIKSSSSSESSSRSSSWSCSSWSSSWWRSTSWCWRINWSGRSRLRGASKVSGQRPWSWSWWQSRWRWWSCRSWSPQGSGNGFRHSLHHSADTFVTGHAFYHSMLFMILNERDVVMIFSGEVLSHAML